MEPTVVPVGWKRAIVKEKVVYMSPSGQLLQSTEAVQTYLSSDGTCKCGLECPIILDKVFNFDPRVFCKPRTAQEASNDNGLTNLCNHKRKVVAMATWLDSVETTKVEDNVTANKPGPSKSKPISNFATEMQFPNFPASNMLPNSMHPGSMPQMNQMNLMHHIDSIPFDAHMQRNTIEAQQHQMRMLYEFHQQFGTNLKQRKPKNQGEFFAGNQQHMQQQQMPFPGHSVPGMSPPRFANPGMPRFSHQRFPFPGEFNQQQHPGTMANLHSGAIPRGMPQGMMSPPMGNMFPRAQHPHAANNPQMCMPGMFGENVSMYMTGPTSPTFPRMRHPGVRPKKKRARSADQVEVPTTCSPIQHVLCESDTRSMSASNLLSIAARAQLANKQQQEAVCKMPNLASQLLQLPHEELTKMIKAHQEQAKRESSEKSEQSAINHVINQVQAGPTDNPSENPETRKSSVTDVQESQSEVDGDGEMSHQDSEKKTAENPPEGKESLCEPQCKDVPVDQEKFHDSGSFETHSSPSHAKCVSQTSESTVGSPETLAKEIEGESTKNQTMPEEPTKCEKSEEGKDSSLEVQSSKPISNHPMEHVINEEELHRLKMEQQYYHALPGNVQQPLRDGYPVDMMPGVPPRMPVPPGHVVPRMPGIPEIGPMGYPPVPWGGLQNPTFAMHETELDFAPSKKRKRKAKNQRSVSADGLLAHGGMLPHRQMPQMMPFHSPGQPAMSQMVMRNPHMNPPLHNPLQTNQIHEYTPPPHIPGMVRPPFPDQQLVSGTHMHVPQLEQQNINSLPVIVQSALEDAQLRNILPQLQQQRLYMKSTGPKKVKDMLADLRNSNQTAVTSANSDTSSQDVSAITQTISETMNTPSGVPVSQAVGLLEQTVSKETSQPIIELDPLFSLPRDSVKTHNAEDNEPLNTMHCSSSADSLSDGQNLSGLAASEPTHEQYSSTLGDLESEDTQTVEHPVEQDQTFDNSKDSLNNLGVHVRHDKSVIHPAPGDNVEDAQCVSREPVSEAAETSVEVPKESSEAIGNAIEITCSTSPLDKAQEVHQVQESGSPTTSSMPSVSEEQEVATALLSMTDQPLKSPFNNISETCLQEDKLAINPAADISQCEDTVKTLESSIQLNNNEGSTVKKQSNDEVISVVTYSLPVTGKDASSDQVAQVEDSSSNYCTADEVTINIERDVSSSTVALQDQMIRLENTDVQEIENTDIEFDVTRNSNALPMEAACEDKAKDSPQSQGGCSTLCLKVHESIQDSSYAENSELISQADAEDSSKGHTTGIDSVMSGIQLSSEGVKENTSQVEGQCATDTETLEGGKELDFEREKETDSERKTTVENSGLDNQLIRTDLKCDMENAKELCEVEEKCARVSSEEGSEGISSENVDSNERTVERLSPECNVNSNNSNSSDHLIPSEEVCDVDLNSNTKPMEAISDTSDSCVDNVVCDASVIDIPGESVMQSTCEESVPMEVLEQVPVTSGKYDVDMLSDLCEGSESTSPPAPCGLDNELNIEGAKDKMMIDASDQVQESTAFPSEGSDKDVSDAAASSADLLEDVPSSENKTESQERQMRPDFKLDNTAVQDMKPETKCQAIKDGGSGGGGRVALRDSSVNNIQEVVPVSELIKKPADLCDSVTSAMDRSTDNGIVGDEASCSPNHDEESSFSPEVETGDLVWGQIRGYSSWPGKVVSDAEVKGQKKKEEGKVWVMWFGDHSFTQVEPTKLKTLTEGLEAHHKARTRHRTRHRTLTSSLEAAIQEAMMELDKKTEQANEKKRKTAARGRSRLKRQKIR
eukprot:XP_011662302.1 PREDICTED: uncharacterized protein LOC100890897 isoform X1 [Strongylocentrotus purpuratus]